MAITNMGAVYGHKYARNLLLDGFADDPTDKLSNFQRQKIDYLFHVLYGEYMWSCRRRRSFVVSLMLL